MSWPPTFVSPRKNSHVKTKKFSWILKDFTELYTLSPVTIFAFDNSPSTHNLQR